MTSMRKLNRRLLRWQRYAAKVENNLNRQSGFRRAELAYNNELDRRIWAETPEIWLGGPQGEAALIGDVLGPPYVVSVPDISEWRLP